MGERTNQLYFRIKHTRLQLELTSPRPIDVLVLSDVQLGRLWTSARMLNVYLSSIDPCAVVLLGNFFNIKAFNKFLFPNAQNVIIERLLNWAKKAVPVFYILDKTDEKFMHFETPLMPFVKVSALAHIQCKDDKNYFFFNDYDALEHHVREAKMSVAAYIFPQGCKEKNGITLHHEKIVHAKSWRAQKSILELTDNVWVEKKIEMKQFDKTLKQSATDFSLQSYNRRKEILSVILNEKCEIEEATNGAVIKKNSVERNQFYP